MAAQPDPAKLVHRAAVRRVKGQGALLVLAGPVQVTAREGDLAGQEVHVGFVRRELRGLGRGGGGDRGLAGGKRGLRDAHMGLPVTGGEPPGLRRRPQRLPVVAQVHQRVGGQPVRPLLDWLDGGRPVGGLNGFGEAVSAQVRAGEQAPGPAAARLGRD